MGRETRKIIGPPAWMAGLVEALIPSAHRGFIAGDLRQRYEGPLQFMSLAAKSIAGNVRDQMRETFDIRLVAGEACILYIAFAGPPAPLTIVLAVTVGAFLLRDAYIHPAEGSPREAATNANFSGIRDSLPPRLLQFALKYVFQLMFCSIQPRRSCGGADAPPRKRVNTILGTCLAHDLSGRHSK